MPCEKLPTYFAVEVADRDGFSMGHPATVRGGDDRCSARAF